MRNWKDKISEHISYTEAVKSATALNKGIDNTPDEATIKRMKLVAEKVFEPLRNHFGVPIIITSFYRSPALNKAVGGSKSSDHIKGCAMDIDADVLGMVSNRQLFNYIKDNLQFDQLIWEHGDDKEPAWVHVSYEESGNKCQVLQTYKEKDWRGKTVTKYKSIN